MHRNGFRIAAAAAITAIITTSSVTAETTLTAASCFPIGSPPGKPFEALVEEINKQGAGIIRLDLIGGAPAIGSPFTLTQKMSRGAYDVVGCTEAYFGNVVAEGAVLRLSERHLCRTAPERRHRLHAKAVRRCKHVLSRPAP